MGLRTTSTVVFHEQVPESLPAKASSSTVEAAAAVGTSARPSAPRPSGVPPITAWTEVKVKRDFEKECEWEVRGEGGGGRVDSSRKEIT